MNPGSYLVAPQTLGAGQTLTIFFLAPIFAGDLSQTTAISVSVLRRDGSTAVQNWTIVAATPQMVTAQYILQAGDITTTGAYYLSASLSVPAGNLVAETVTLFVTSQFSTSPRLETSAWLAATSAIAAAPPASFQPWVIVSASSSPYNSTPLLPWVAWDGSSGSGSVNVWTPTQDAQFVVVSPFRGAGSVAVHASGTNTATSSAWALWNPASPGTFTGTVTLSTGTGAYRARAAQALGLWLPW